MGLYLHSPIGTIVVWEANVRYSIYYNFDERSWDKFETNDAVEIEMEYLKRIKNLQRQGTYLILFAQENDGMVHPARYNLSSNPVKKREENQGRYIEMWGQDCRPLPTNWRALRKLTGLTQKNFGKKLGYTAAAIKKWETDERISHASIWLWALVVCGFHPDYIISKTKA